ncbi:lytic transglycosylase domain-containing protein [Bradyrhizobium sp. 83012]|uniref:Lytic transglycosylase domain-containing protein n=1 Tax=Bradyrhizobium aeschynomenes TaxID=2734909 RepID=A0ABX2CL30_9BRAD|nr:lytic transglycosylase domain-containing protein [Bradyrhizobium aeschynomenes]NPU68899.1 lytic transglycosylase domain-containing protein [Bradyrhizobium aeschynomenes]
MHISISAALGVVVCLMVATTANVAANEGETVWPLADGAPAVVGDGGKTPAGAKEDDKPAEPKESGTREAICLMIEAAAKANDLPLEFFARVIWQESRFQTDAVGPVTRNGQRAQGIAQFMPGTASERELLDPFDPVQALPKSAEFLAELRNQFGNLGLAAAAYNAGPRRVQDWLAGKGQMPWETRNYVSAITGASVDDWAAAGKGSKALPNPPPTSCRQLMALLKRGPNPFVRELEQHVALSAAKPWGVQLAAGFDRNRALSMYSRAIKGLGAVIGDRDPSLLSSVLRSRGNRAFYQVRIGADTRSEADALCNRIRRAGGACFVLRNRA